MAKQQKDVAEEQGELAEAKDALSAARAEYQPAMRSPERPVVSQENM